MHAQSILRSQPVEPPVERTGGDVISCLLDTSQACSILADACLSAFDPALAQCGRLATDCSEITLVAARVAMRRTGSNEAVVLGLLMLCEALCRDCAAECGNLGRTEAIYIDCAASCRRSETRCRDARAELANSIVQ